MVERADHGITTAAARLGGIPGHPSAGQRTQRRNDEEQPRAKRMGLSVADKGLAMSAQCDVAGQVFEEKLLGVLESRKEAGADGTSRQAHHGGVKQRAP